MTLLLGWLPVSSWTYEGPSPRDGDQEAFLIEPVPNFPYGSPGDFEFLFQLGDAGDDPIFLVGAGFDAVAQFAVNLLPDGFGRIEIDHGRNRRRSCPAPLCRDRAWQGMAGHDRIELSRNQTGTDGYKFQSGRGGWCASRHSLATGPVAALSLCTSGRPPAGGCIGHLRTCPHWARHVQRIGPAVTS